MVKGNEEMILFWEKSDNVYGVFLLFSSYSIMYIALIYVNKLDQTNLNLTFC